jgi:O-6-methylguanine DNA methyltransferase
MCGDCILESVRVTRYLYDVPGWGLGEVWASDGVIVHHELASEALRAAVEGAAGGEEAARAKPSATPPNGGSGLPARTVAADPLRDRAAFVPDLCRRIGAHLGGVPTRYDGIPIDLDWATPLQHELAAAARAIPWGEVVSYGELAALAGRPRAARAAGSFCADNRFSLIIPCHRVVAANGIGGYGVAGPALKRRLLALEGVHL